MTININFGGARIQRPGAYSTVDSANMVPVAAGGFKILAIVGIPNTTNSTAVGGVYYFNDPQVARGQIGACEALDLMNISWKHGADLIAFSPVASTATDMDWQAAIDLLQAEFVDGVQVASTAPAIQAKVDVHCTLMSSVINRKERRAFYGHANKLSTKDIVALQTALNSELGLMASPGVYDYDEKGEKVLKPSNYLAAAYAGIWASQPSQEPITYKYVKFPGLEKNYIGTEITELLAGHIAPVEHVKNKGYRIVQGLTLSADEDLTKQELSVSSAKIEMSQTIRNTLEAKYVGKAGVKGIEVTIYNDLVSLIENKFIKAGLITEYAKGSVSVIKNGTSFITQWEGKPTLPINNFLITSHLTL